MPFKEGNTYGQNGRPKNSKNKSTKQIREGLSLLFQNNIDALQTTIDEIEDPAKKLKLLFDLANIVLPRQKQVDSTVSYVSEQQAVNEFRNQFDIEPSDKPFDIKEMYSSKLFDED